MSLDKQIAALQADLNAAHYVTYLTGAGVSTPSHIPDYRSKMEFTMGFRKAQNKF